ncbi:hypothetical protein ABE493_10620 [Stenotrophomonas terrae]|uniref:hypothetical protein n=1 Tax=Stenotrophomonas terrae TaxID=405446 RepID=UPI0032099086
MHKFSKARELINSARQLGLDAELAEPGYAGEYIRKVLGKFKPFRVSGHLQIGGGAMSVPTEGNEYALSKQLKEEMGCVFFEQGILDRNNLVVFKNATEISLAIEHSFGMEYFISNEGASYLIAVNFYGIEFAGDIEIRDMTTG